MVSQPGRNARPNAFGQLDDKAPEPKFLGVFHVAASLRDADFRESRRDSPTCLPICLCVGAYDLTNAFVEDQAPSESP